MRRGCGGGRRARTDNSWLMAVAVSVPVGFTRVCT